jgi:hypothetical protein
LGRRREGRGKRHLGNDMYEVCTYAAQLPGRLALNRRCWAKAKAKRDAQDRESSSEASMQGSEFDSGVILCRQGKQCMRSHE